MRVHTIVNGRRRTLGVEAGELLLDVLRREGYRGVKFGCGAGDCGACTVLLDGEPVNSCLLLAARIDGHEVTTIEGLGSVDSPHALQHSFAVDGAVQCGYCIPGSILSVHALLRRVPDPSDSEIRDALDGNLCRCTGYVKKIEAVKHAGRALRGESDEG